MQHFTGQHCWTAAGCWRHLSSNSHRNQFQLQLIFDSCRAPMPFGPKILTWIWQSLIWCHLDKMSFRVCLWSWGSCCQFQSCHGWASCPGAIFLLTSATFYQLGIKCLVTWPSFHLIKDTCCQLQCLYKWQFPLKCTKLNLLFSFVSFWSARVLMWSKHLKVGWQENLSPLIKSKVAPKPSQLFLTWAPNKLLDTFTSLKVDPFIPN